MAVFLTSGFWVGSAVASEPFAPLNASGSFHNPGANKMLRVTEQREGNRIHFLVENLEPADVTATFNVGMVNLKGTTRFPYTTTVAPHQKLEVFSLSPIDKSREWHFSLTNAYTLGSNRAVHDDSYVYALPYQPGHAFRVTQADDGAFSHTGPERHAIDWMMPEGTPVLAARGGVVVSTKDDSDTGGPDRRFENSANYVLIEHRDGTIGNYAHLLKHGVRVKIGQVVQPGEEIGLSGNTGFSSGPHLHFSVFKTVDGNDRESIPIRFRTTDQPAARLESGRVYRAPESELAAKKNSLGS